MAVGGIRGGFGLQNFNIGGAADSKSKMGVKPGYESAPGDCKTCKSRKYQDGSDENVSFKTGAHVSPIASGAAVRAHENEHVTNAYLKAAESGGKVLSVGVSIHTAVCPECGRVYTAGGETRSVISKPKEDPYSKNKDELGELLNTGARTDITA